VVSVVVVVVVECAAVAVDLQQAFLASSGQRAFVQSF
jgi:hypothetical protein